MMRTEEMASANATADTSPDILTEYKTALADLYRQHVRRKEAIRARHGKDAGAYLAACDRELRAQINELQEKLGIRY